MRDQKVGAETSNNDINIADKGGVRIQIHPIHVGKQY